MSESVSNVEDAILADVIQNPDDDLPRLAYADWLDEHGDEIRAKFIRAQLRLFRSPENDPECEPLRNRCWELWGSHRATLAGDLGPIIQQQAGRYPAFDEFWRGFVERLAYAL